MLQLQRCDCFKTILALLPRCLLGGRGRPLQLFLSEGPEVYGHIFFCFPLLAFFSLLACLIIMGPGIGTRKLTHRQGTPGCTSHTRGPTTCRSVGHQVIALESVSIHATELHEHHYSCVSLRDAHACAVAGSTVGGVLMFFISLLRVILRTFFICVTGTSAILFSESGVLAHITQQGAGLYLFHARRRNPSVTSIAKAFFQG